MPETDGLYEEIDLNEEEMEDLLLASEDIRRELRQEAAQNPLEHPVPPTPSTRQQAPPFPETIPLATARDRKAAARDRGRPEGEEQPEEARGGRRLGEGEPGTQIGKVIYEDDRPGVEPEPPPLGPVRYQDDRPGREYVEGEFEAAPPGRPPPAEDVAPVPAPRPAPRPARPPRPAPARGGLPPEHPVMRRRAQAVTGRYAGQEITTVRGSRDDPMSPKEHAQMSEYHAGVAAVAQERGDEAQARAHVEAATHHAQVAQNKQRLPRYVVEAVLAEFPESPSRKDESDASDRLLEMAREKKARPSPEATVRYQQAYQAFSAGQARRLEVARAARERLQQILRPRTPGTFSAALNPGYAATDEARDSITDAFEFVRSVTEGGAMSDAILVEENDREVSSYTRHDRAIRVGIFYSRQAPDYVRNFLPRNIVHELGHYIEHVKPGVLDRAVAFVEARCAGEREADLGAKYKTRNLQGVMGRKDRWDRVFSERDAYYIGRLYQNPKDGSVVGTEVVSMGIQALYEDPVNFMKQDPEYAELILDMLRS